MSCIDLTNTEYNRLDVFSKKYTDWKICSLGSYGSFYSTQSQFILQANRRQVITFNGTYDNRFISVVNDEKITFQYSGIYQLTFTAQVFNISNSFEDASFWIKYNGVDFPNSTTSITLQQRKGSGQPSEQIVTINITGRAQNDNDYIELWWRATSTDVYLGYVTHSTIPDAPSIKASITPVTKII